MFTDEFDYAPDGTLLSEPLPVDVGDLTDAMAVFPKNPEDVCVNAALLGLGGLLLGTGLMGAAGGFPGGTGAALKPIAPVAFGLLTTAAKCGDSRTDSDDNSSDEESFNWVKLSKSDESVLARCGIDINELKQDIVGGSGALFDLYEDKLTGNIYVLRKGGMGEPQPTGLNIKKLRQIC